MFRAVLLSIIRSFSLYTQQYIQVCWQQAVSKPVWHIPLQCAQWKTPDDGQRNCTKHVEFHSKNKFEKLVHLVGFIIRIYHDARSPERQKRITSTLHDLCTFGSISPNSSYNNKCFTQKLQWQSKHTFMLNTIFPKIVPFIIWKYGTAHRCQYGACALHAG